MTGHEDGQRTASGSIPLVGVIDFDNRRFSGGAFGDDHIMQGELIDDETLRYMSVETGDHAWVTRTTCRRVEGG